MMRSILILIITFGALMAQANVVQMARWTASDDPNGAFDHVLQVANTKTGLSLTSADYLLVEERDLANNHFSMYSQIAGGLPISGMSIRIWTELKSTKLVQAEVRMESPQKYLQFLSLKGLSISEMETNFRPSEAMKIVRRILQKSDDPALVSLKSSEVWLNGIPVRVFEIKGRRGKHKIVLSLLNQSVVSSEYVEFPQADSGFEYNIPALVYPIYEEVETTGHMMTRVSANLNYIKSTATRTNSNPYAPLLAQHYYETMLDPVLGETAAGRAKGYWSMSYVKDLAAQIRNKLPQVDNTVGNPNGVILEGRYATISLHPDVTKKFTGINFTPQVSAQFKPDWQVAVVNGTQVGEMIPRSALLGRPLMSLAEALQRPARRLPNHDPVGYINDGFDELQVYFAVNTLMESLHNMGLTDPELSTRPFNAFLYDPDISMRDNAFYTDDTINFTTYSPKLPNMARDNSTIWHELGHGIMDRLMGDAIQLADTGGLSEGMADFVAAMVIAYVTDGKPFDGSDGFRIINNTGFNLTNEVHDDGEAYGGSMKDLLDAAVSAYGHAGVIKIADLTMEAMRLSRNHPGLTATDWFNHMLFADSLGHTNVRAPGELKGLILNALNGRNFDLGGATTANYSLKNGTQELLAGTPGTRNNPIRLSLPKDGKATFHLSAQLKNGSSFKFNFPVELRIYFLAGPLQGAIHWEGKGPQPVVYKLNSESDVAKFDLAAYGTCDQINREDGSCVDYAYVQVWNPGAKKPAAKKRFYLRIKTQ